MAAGSRSVCSVFFFDLPFTAAGCTWRAEPEGGAGAGPGGGGLGVRAIGVDEVVAVVVTVPFMASGKTIREGIGGGSVGR